MDDVFTFHGDDSDVEIPPPKQVSFKARLQKRKRTLSDNEKHKSSSSESVRLDSEDGFSDLELDNVAQSDESSDSEYSVISSTDSEQSEQYTFYCSDDEEEQKLSQQIQTFICSSIPETQSDDEQMTEEPRKPPLSWTRFQRIYKIFFFFKAVSS